MDPHTLRMPVKDEKGPHPVASAWRPVFHEIVSAFARGDHALARPVVSVAPVSASTADQVKRYLASFGETLRALSEETWETSVAQWMTTHWEVLVDLWTVESGPSDLVLLARVNETQHGFRIEIVSVHVP